MKLTWDRIMMILSLDYLWIEAMRVIAFWEVLKHFVLLEISSSFSLF